MSCCAENHRPFDSDPQFRSGRIFLLGSVLAGLSLATSNVAQGAIMNATSPSLADVTAAIDSAADGDTVTIPDGTALWK